MLKQFIQNNLVAVVAVICLGLTACQSTGGYKNEWNQPVAQQAPHTLDKSTIQATQQGDMLRPLPDQGGQVTVYPDGQTPVDGGVYADGTQAVQGQIPQGQQGPDYSSPANMPVTKVAILLPLSGQHTRLGNGMLQATQLALFELGNDKIEILPRDTYGTAAGARDAAQDAINSGASVILGPVFSHSVQAVKPIANRANVNVIAFSTDWTLSDNNTYIMGFLPFGQVRRVAEYAHAQGYRKVGILAPDNEYGNAVISAYNSVAYRTGSQRAHVVKFPVGINDISTIVRSFTQYDDRVEALNQRIRPLQARVNANPNDSVAAQQLAELQSLDTYGEAPYDAVLLPVGGETARSIASLLSFYDMPPQTVKRLGTGLWDDQALSSETALSGGWFATASASSRKDFERKYRNLYGEHPPRLSTLAYDATALAIILANNSLYAYGDVQFRREDIMNPNGFAGVDGIFRFRRDGTIERGLAVMEIGRGGPYVVDPAPQTFQATRNF